MRYVMYLLDICVYSIEYPAIHKINVAIVQAYKDAVSMLDQPLVNRFLR